MEATPARTWTVAGSARHVTRRVMARYPASTFRSRDVASRRARSRPTRSLVIDGFTRSASTFAVVAFQLAQNDHVRVAHHLHAPAHLLAATRAEVPTLMPIRPPRDTVLSAAIREPTVSMGQWLRSYADFYRRMKPVLDQIVVATFESVTTDMGGLIDRVNERFATSFVRFEDSVRTPRGFSRSSRNALAALPGNTCSGVPFRWSQLGRVSARDRSDPHQLTCSRGAGGRVQRPSASREQAKGAVSALYDSKTYDDARRAAEHAYESAARVAR